MPFCSNSPEVAHVITKCNISGYPCVGCRVWYWDAGCGTGLYAKVLFEMGIGKLSLLDASPAMLFIAKVNLNDAIKQNIVDAVVEAKLPDLPFEDGIFDAVMFNQVSLFL